MPGHGWEPKLCAWQELQEGTKGGRPGSSLPWLAHAVPPAPHGCSAPRNQHVLSAGGSSPLSSPGWGTGCSWLCFPAAVERPQSSRGQARWLCWWAPLLPTPDRGWSRVSLQPDRGSPPVLLCWSSAPAPDSQSAFRLLWCHSAENQVFSKQGSSAGFMVLL